MHYDIHSRYDDSGTEVENMPTKKEKRETLKERILGWGVDKSDFTRTDVLNGPAKGLGLHPQHTTTALAELRAAGLVKSTGVKRGMKYNLTKKALKSRPAPADEVPAPPVEEESGEVPVNPWLVARSHTGQRAANIITLLDAVLAGDAGLNVLGEARNQAIFILGDLDLLED